MTNDTIVIESTCSRVKMLLSRYQDNELDRETYEKTKLHLLHCTTCSEELKQLEMTAADIKQLPEIDTPPYFTSRVMGKLERNEHKNESEKPRWIKIMRPSFAYSFTFIVFLILGFLVSYNLYNNNNYSTKNGNEKKPTAPSLTITQILEESQDLRLISVQEQSIKILDNNRGGE